MEPPSNAESLSSVNIHPHGVESNPEQEENNSSSDNLIRVPSQDTQQSSLSINATSKHSHNVHTLRTREMEKISIGSTQSRSSGSISDVGSKLIVFEGFLMWY